MPRTKPVLFVGIKMDQLKSTMFYRGQDKSDLVRQTARHFWGESARLHIYRKGMI